MTRISEKYLCSRWGAGHRVDGSLHGTNLHIIPTYTYINKETRLAKFPALSRVIKFKYHRRGWSMRMRWEAEVETRMGKKKASWRTRKRARQDVHRRSKICGHFRASYIYVKKGVTIYITTRLNKFCAFQFCTLRGGYIFYLIIRQVSY